MAINFPNTPSDGDTHAVGDVTFTYNAAKTLWSPIPASGGSSTLAELTDTTLTTPTSGQVLSYDVTNSVWINTSSVDAYTKTEVDTALTNKASSTHTHDYSPTAHTHDLSAYDTSVQVDTKIAAIPDTDLSAYDTSAQVDTKIAAIPDTDLSAYDTSAQVDTKVAGIVDSAPATLDTLNELAAALGDDANHVTTMTTLVGTKADQSTTYTKAEVDTSLNLKSDKTTTYTKTEVDTALTNKSDTTHTHDYAATAHTHTNSIDHLTDVDVTTAAPTTDQVLKYDGTNWIPADDVAGSGGTTSTGGTYTAGVIWDNHDSSRAEHDVALSVAADATLALTHDADTEELRSVYIEKYVEISGGSEPTKKVTVMLSSNNSNGT